MNSKLYLNFNAIFLVLFVTFITTTSSIAQSKYAEIIPQEVEININTQNLEVLKVIPIYSKNKSKLYELSITTVSFDKNSVGLIQILLNSVNKNIKDNELKYEPNILNPDRWGHGEGNWIFRPSELKNQGNDDNNLGRKRVFVMRKMKILVELTNVNFTKDFTGISNLTLKIEIKKDLSNRSRPVFNN